jgi:acetyl-CoA carboxylase biotin carboxyl carrier protein
MDYKEIQDLLRLVSRTNLTDVEIEKGDFKIRIQRKPPENNIIYTAPGVAQPPAGQPLMPALPAHMPERGMGEEVAERSEAPSANLIEFRSPMIGTFYRSPGPGSAAFVQVGDTVRKGQVLCIIEAMKLFNEIESEFDGKIVKILVENAQPVEYDQPLFLIDPNA